MGVESYPSNARVNNAFQTTAPASPRIGDIWVDSDGAFTGYDPSVPYGFRNILINGSGEIAQRGTVAPALQSVINFPVDRWWLYSTGAALTSHGFTGAVVPPTGGRGSIALRGKTGVTWANLGQRIEAANAYIMRGPITFSAYIYNNSGADFTPSIAISTPTVEDVFSTVNVRGSATLANCPNGAWTRVTATFDCTSWTNLNFGMQAEVGIPGANLNADTKYIYVTNLQLERGTTATPYEVRPFGMELALCQRYYYRHATGNLMSVCHMSYWSATAAYGTVPFPVSMRTAPALDCANGTNYFGLNAANVVDLFNTFTGMPRATSTCALIGVDANVSGTPGYSGDCYTNNASAYLGFSAEL